MKNQGSITAARLGESAHASGTKVRNQRRDGCERRRIEIARDTLEGGALAHQRLLLTRLSRSAGRRTAGRGGPISAGGKARRAGAAAGGGPGGRGGATIPATS